jgi:hypothetical protein
LNEVLPTLIKIGNRKEKATNIREKRRAAIFDNVVAEMT